MVKVAAGVAKEAGIVVIGSSVSALRGQGRWLIMVRSATENRRYGGRSTTQIGWCGLLHGGDGSRWDGSGLVWVF
ncbi:hypothetical protein M0R45_009213 [Rubus argutus]|uniref:Uncharacterized protein n=1 Tax=Rubus argutus TaxID=59490 RepID=A0AAW1Y3H5_RUBAR